MKEISSTVVLYLFNLVSTYFMFLGYSFISKEKFKYNFKNIVFVIILAFLFLLNKKFNIVVSSVLTSIILLLLFSKIIFKNNSICINILFNIISLRFYIFVFLLLVKCYNRSRFITKLFNYGWIYFDSYISCCNFM